MENKVQRSCFSETDDVDNNDNDDRKRPIRHEQNLKLLNPVVQ